MCRYLGDWVLDDKTGQGTQWFGDGSLYKGDWVTNMRHGTGHYTYADGTT